MIKLDFYFDYEGEAHHLTAMLTDDLDLAKSKINKDVNINEDFGDERRWSLSFDGEEPSIDYEVVLYRDSDGNKVAEAEYIIIWDLEHDCIADEVDCITKITYK